MLGLGTKEIIIIIVVIIFIIALKKIPAFSRKVSTTAKQINDAFKK